MARFEENLQLLERGRLELPPNIDIGAFLPSDGKLNGQAAATPPSQILNLSGLRDAFIDVHSNGAMEKNSLFTVSIHLRHVTATLGGSFQIGSLTTTDLQGHIDRRARKRYRGQPLSPATLRKEIASLRACWNWAVQAGRLKGAFSSRGLKYPKTDETPLSNSTGDRTPDRSRRAVPR